jgi:DNA-binding MarR family transcriptional regulator
MKDTMDKNQIQTLREKLRILERESGGVFGEQQDCCGVTVSQCHTLLEVGKREPVSLIDLAAELNLDASTLSRTVQGLVLLGLLDRRTDAGDRRYVTIGLTAQGRKVVAAIEEKYDAFFKAVLGRLPAGSRASIIESISAFVDAVRAHNESTGCCRPGRKS